MIGIVASSVVKQCCHLFCGKLSTLIMSAIKHSKRKGVNDKCFLLWTFWFLIVIVLNFTENMWLLIITLKLLSQKLLMLFYFDPLAFQSGQGKDIKVIIISLPWIQATEISFLAWLWGWGSSFFFKLNSWLHHYG